MVIKRLNEQYIVQRMNMPNIEKMTKLCQDLLNPDALGFAVSAEVRDRARMCLGIKPCEFKPFIPTVLASSPNPASKEAVTHPENNH